MNKNVVSVPVIVTMPPLDAVTRQEIIDLLTEEGVEARLDRGTRLMESATPPVEIVFNIDVRGAVEYLTAAWVGKKFVESYLTEAGKDAYQATKKVLSVIGRNIEEIYQQIKDKKNRQTFFTVKLVRANDKVHYNVPGIDHEAALQALMDEIVAPPSNNPHRHLFWNYGRWIDGEEYRLVRDRFEEPIDAISVPTPEFLSALSIGTDLFGYALTFRALRNQRDVLVEIPAGSDRETIQGFVNELRTVMPKSTVGFTSERHILFVSDAVGPSASEIEE